jgi:hypothetical protein
VINHPQALAHFSKIGLLGVLFLLQHLWPVEEIDVAHIAEQSIRAASQTLELHEAMLVEVLLGELEMAACATQLHYNRFHKKPEPLSIKHPWANFQLSA